MGNSSLTIGAPATDYLSHRLQWELRRVRVGATFTALLFSLGKFLIGLRLVESTVGSFVPFLAWVNRFSPL